MGVKLDLVEEQGSRGEEAKVISAEDSKVKVVVIHKNNQNTNKKTHKHKNNNQKPPQTNQSVTGGKFYLLFII